MQLSKIIDYAKGLGYSDAELVERRADGDIYLLTNSTDNCIDGMPQYITVANDVITVMSPENALFYGYKKNIIKRIKIALCAMQGAFLLGG